MSARVTEIEDLREEVEVLRAALAEREKDVSTRDAALAERDEVIAAKDEQMLALARQLGDRKEEADALNNLGTVAQNTGAIWKRTTAGSPFHSPSLFDAMTRNA